MHSVNAARDDLKKRIAHARRCIAYADRCERDVKSLRLSPAQQEIIKADAEAVRRPAKQLLHILLAELEGMKR